MRARGRLTPPRKRYTDGKHKHFEQAEAPPAPEVRCTPEQALWIAVIERALMDAQGLDAFRASVARSWLLEAPEFLLVADYAGVENPAALREVLRRHFAPPAPVVRLAERRRATILTGPTEWLRAA